MLLRLLPLFALPLLAGAGLLGDLVPNGSLLLCLALLSSAAVAVDCATKPAKRHNVLVFLLICMLLYSAQLAALLYPKLARAREVVLPQLALRQGVALLPHGLVGRGRQVAAKPEGGAPVLPATLPPGPVRRPGADVAVPAPAPADAAATAFGGSVAKRVARTVSIVLPCAEERDNALNTVQRFCERTPDDQLAEIIVVDDGSSPPMKEIFARDKRRLDQNQRCKLRILRHESTTGLMAAKLTGGKEARGDVIAFFDCHCSPKPGWQTEILQKVSENPRMMVVPAITDLDMDTFDEKVNSAVNAKCYLTFDADFKWFDDESDAIPTISGGLVAMGREWFNLTGGFDEQMHGWGGEISRAKSSRVAHMWRTGDPRTRTRYSVKASRTDNRGRVAAAWFDAFLPVYRGHKMAPESVKNFDAVKRRLGCKPFSYFLYRFRKVYIEGGVIAKEVFHLRDKASQLCLAHVGVTRAVPCDQNSITQRFQLGNLDRQSRLCCSGLRAYGSNDCMDYFDKNGGHYYSCDVTGQNMNQQHHLQPDGRIQREHSECLVVDAKLGSVKKKACAALLPTEGIFEKLNVFAPQEWQIYQQEVAKHRFAEEFPGLPDN